MINKIKVIKSRSPIKEIWKYLRYYKDRDFSLEKIKSDFPQASIGNARKQAEQIGYCIRQAEEYFNASVQTSLATRPLLLYYGAMSLSFALILLRNDGEHSIDFLRDTRKHQHHGLLLKGQIKSNSSAKNWETFFKKTESKLFVKNKEPHGTFSLLYKSIVPSCIDIEIRESVLGRKANLISMRTHGHPKIPDINHFENPVSCIELFSNIPDLYEYLRDGNQITNLCKGGVQISFITRSKTHHEAIADVYLDDVDTKMKERFIKNYNFLKVESEMESNVHFQTEKTFPDKNKIELELPFFISDNSGQSYHIINPDRFYPELVSFYMTLYCLGTLSRYYPDIWMKVVDKKVIINEFVNYFLDIAHNKFPQLILEQMNLIKYKFN